MASAHVLKGMGDIINPDNVKNGYDLLELERSMIGDGLIAKPAEDAMSRLNEELAMLTKRIGLNSPDLHGTAIKGTIKNRNDNFTSKPSPKFGNVASPLSRSPLNMGGSPRGSPGLRMSDLRTANTSHTTDSDEEDDDDQSEHRTPQVPQSSQYFGQRSPVIMDPLLRSQTNEQRMRSHIESTIGSDNFIDDSVLEREKQEDMKCAMLAEIDSLIQSLEDEGMDLSRIPAVTRDSPFKMVESTMKVLRNKNDHSRYCSFAQEFILFGAYAAEEIFNGERVFFGKYRPDLTGWHNNVSMKLRRLKHETGVMVRDIMQDYNIGPAARIALELIPNAFIYSHMRKKQHNQPSLTSDEEFSNANNMLNSL